MWTTSSIAWGVLSMTSLALGASLAGAREPLSDPMTGSVIIKIDAADISGDTCAKNPDGCSIHSMKDFKLCICPFSARTETKGLGEELFLLHSPSSHLGFDTDPHFPHRSLSVCFSASNTNNCI